MLQTEILLNAVACSLHRVHTRTLLADCIVCTPETFLQVLPALATIEPCCICLASHQHCDQHHRLVMCASSMPHVNSSCQHTSLVEICLGLAGVLEE